MQTIECKSFYKEESFLKFEILVKDRIQKMLFQNDQRVGGPFIVPSKGQMSQPKINKKRSV